MVDPTHPAEGTTVLLVGDGPARSPTVQRCGSDDPERLRDLLERLLAELRRRAQQPGRWHRSLLVVFRDPDGMARRLPAGTARLMSAAIGEIRSHDPDTTRIAARIERADGDNDNEDQQHEGKEQSWRRC